jgi:hypothetical protein
MNPLNLAVAVLYAGAVIWELTYGRTSFAVLYGAWCVGCLAIAYIEAQ